MILHRVSLTEAARRLKQIRQIVQDQGLVVLTSHEKPVLLVVEVERGRQLLAGAEQLARLVAADNLLNAARAIGAADEWRLGVDVDWIRQALADLQDDERSS